MLRRRQLGALAALQLLGPSLLSASMLVGATGCGGKQTPDDAAKTVLSLHEIEDSHVGEDLEGFFSTRSEVYEASFERRRAELTVVAQRGFDAFAVAQKVAKQDGYTLFLGAGKGSYVGWMQPHPRFDVKVLVSDGRDYPKLAAAAVPGKVTVALFVARWSKNSRELYEYLLEVMLEEPRLALRLLQVVEMNSPLAGRHLQGVVELPFSVVFDPKGTELDRFAGDDRRRMDMLLAEQLRKRRAPSR
jgi:hypothetical protein